MIERFADPGGAARWCADRRAAGESVGLVPTMGALHAGHLSLVQAARERCARVCVSVFVNPLQFDEGTDFEAYPRDFEGDAALLEGAGCDCVFTGTLAGFFPGSGGDLSAVPRLDPGPAALGLEGAHRSGHFEGVATIVARLFELTRPDVAFFGEKDFQQTLVVRHLARARGGPRIVVRPVSREPDGLARSSRNVRLSPRARERAPMLHRALLAAREAWSTGERRADALARPMRALLEAVELELEYAEVRDPSAWSAAAPAGELARAVALVAARLDGVRLIDCLRLDAEGEA